MVRTILCVLLAAFTLPAWADANLVRQLREGGYVLYMRHASTDFSQNDARMTSYDDCASQRNLLDKGRAEARSVAEHVRRLRIPVGTVLASPFCRTMETARLAFGNPFYAVAGPPYLQEGEIAVVRPGGKDFKVVGRIRIEDWPRLD